jgi:hypothetical protein
MKTILAIAIGLALLVVAVLAAKLAHTLREPPAELAMGDDDQGESETHIANIWDPDTGQEELVVRINLKQEVAAALIRGETTLSAAAGRFREISGGSTASLVQMRAMYPRASDEELWQRQVIGFVRGFRNTDPHRLAVLLSRLELEVARRFPPRPIESPQLQNARRNVGAPQAAQVRVSVSPPGPRGSRAKLH